MQSPLRVVGQGRDLHQQWNNPNLFIDYWPATNWPFTTKKYFGATHSNDLDISISAWALDERNRWMIAATIVHELAHMAGAPGGSSHAAERAVRECGFGDQYDPDVQGSIQDISKYLRALA